MEVDHEVAVNVAKTRHRSGRKHIEDHLLRGASLHAGRARDHFRTNLGNDFQMRGFAQGRPGIADDGDGIRSTCAGVFNGRDGEGSASARCDADDDIVLRRFLLRDGSATERAGVLVGLDGRGQSFGTAGDNELDHARVDVESWRTLRCIERGNASAGAGADVDESPAMRERRGDPIDCLSDLRQSALHRGRNLGVFMVDDAGNFERGLEVQIGGRGVCSFGAEATQVHAGCSAF